MTSMKLTRTSGLVICLAVVIFTSSRLTAAAASGRVDGSALFQATAAAQVPVAKLVAEPASISMRAGEAVALKITAYDNAGNVIPTATVRVNMPRTSGSYADGKVTAFTAGKFVATAVAAGAMGAPPVTLEIPIAIAWPALAKMEIAAEPGRLYTGLTLAHWATGAHADGSARSGLVPAWRSSDSSVATVDRFGNVTAVKAGAVTITAEAEGVSATKAYTVVANPVTTLELKIPETTLRTGDVVRLNGTTKRADGSVVTDAPITWSFTYTAPEGNTVKALGGPGIIDDGLFVANYPGRFNILASAGAAHARTAIEVTQRNVKQRLTITGRGIIRDTHTSDLWPYTGKDGRDYCIVGTWGGDGVAHVFDITDPSNIVKTHSIKIDARTINDVTVSPDARYAVLSREGASNRVNGVVFLDLKDPARPVISSTFETELTG